MEKLQIAFILDSMTIGGIPKALIPYISELGKDADITLILENGKGELQDKIPNYVRQLILPKKTTRKCIQNDFSNNQYICGIKLLLQDIWYGHVCKRWVINSAKIAEHTGYIIGEKYDCAIAFHGMNINNLVRTIYNVNAKVKIAWIHGDHPFSGKHKVDVANLYSRFDFIFNDSVICENNFLRDFPEERGKTVISHPTIDIDDILELSKEPMDSPFDDGRINILTVGRISPEKGQDMIPDIILRLRETGIPFKWYLVGDGSDASRIKSLADEKKCDELVFCGSKKNPYPYIAASDIYVQPSYSEAYSITAFEAATLAKPIVITNVAGATEILRQGKEAEVVEPNADSIALGIRKIMINSDYANTLKANVRKADYSNRSEAQRLIRGLYSGSFDEISAL